MLLKNLIKPLSLVLLFATGYGIGVLTTILAARVLTVSQYGLLNYLFALNSILGSAIALGCDTSPLQFLNKYIAEHKTKHVNLFIYWTIKRLRFNIIGCVLLSLVIFFVIDPFELFFLPKLEPMTKIIAVSILTGTLYALINIFSTYLICDQKVILGTVLANVLISILLIMLYLIGYDVLYLETKNLNVILTLITLAYVCSLITTIIIVKHVMPVVYDIIRSLRRRWLHKVEQPEWEVNAKRQLYKNLLMRFKTRFDLILLGLVSTDYNALAFYGLASLIGKFLYIIPIGVFQNLLPDISFITQSTAQKDNFQRAWNIALIQNVILLSLLYCVIFYSSRSIITKFYGDSYLPSLQLLNILMIGYFIDSVFTVKGNLLAYTGYANQVSISYIFQAIILLISVAILGHDPYHIAISAVIALVLRCGYCVWIIRQKLNFRLIGIL